MSKAKKQTEKKPAEEVVEEAPAVVFNEGIEGEVKLFNKWCVAGRL